MKTTHTHFTVALVSFCSVTVFGACGADPDPVETGGKGGADAAAGSGSGGKSASGGGGPLAGADNAGGQDGGAGAAGDAGAAGAADVGGAGAAGNGGSAGTSGGNGDSGASGSGGDAAGAGGAGTTAPWMRGPALEGPESDEVESVVPAITGVTSYRFGTFDKDGNLYVTAGWNTAALEKYNSDLEFQWSMPLEAGLTLPTAAANGDVYLSGSLNMTVVRYSSSGEERWRHTFPSTPELIDLVAFPGGGSVGIGLGLGQLPGQPPSAAGFPFIARFDDDGNRTSLRQFDYLGSLGKSPSNLIVDAAGDAYISDHGNGGVSKIRPNDALLWSFGTIESARPFGALNHIAMHPDEESLYAIGFPEMADPGPGVTSNCALTRFTRSGIPIWTRVGELNDEVIDPVEGVIWKGFFQRCEGLVVVDDAVFIHGIHSDKFQNGSTPRPDEVSRFVARYDLSGNRVWFKLFAIDGMRSPASTWSSWLGVAKDGNLTYISTASLADPGKIVRLRAADGNAY